MSAWGWEVGASGAGCVSEAVRGIVWYGPACRAVSGLGFRRTPLTRLWYFCISHGFFSNANNYQQTE